MARIKATLKSSARKKAIDTGMERAKLIASNQIGQRSSRRVSQSPIMPPASMPMIEAGALTIE